MTTRGAVSCSYSQCQVPISDLESDRDSEAMEEAPSFTLYKDSSVTFYKIETCETSEPSVDDSRFSCLCLMFCCVGLVFALVSVGVIFGGPF